LSSVNDMLHFFLKDVLQFFEKRKLARDLSDCDFALAGQVLYKKYGQSSSINEFSQLLAGYLGEPCLERALELIENNSALTIYFVECKPNGYYSRKNNKLSPEYTDHIGLAPVAAGAEGAGEDAEEDYTPDINKFPNVLPTIRNYIEDLQMEIDRCRREFDIHMNMTESRRAQLEAWISQCEQGIGEFEEAIRVLNRHSRKTM
jgi:hypothetical protein